MDVQARGSGPDDGREARARRDLERLRAITRLWDQAIGIPGTPWRVGLDPLFGLVPGLGDIAGALVAVFALHVARRLGAPAELQLHMLINIALDAVIGTVPVIGDLFDFVYKAQTRNLALIDGWLGAPHETIRRSRRGLIFLPLAILGVFAILTILGFWMLFIFFHWLFTL
jgi:hypothetical protein